MSESGDTPSTSSPMRRVLGNFGFLVRGRGVAAAMTFAATALMARSLGPVEFGLVMLIQAYVLLVRGLFSFRSFEAVVRYGVPAHDAGDTRTLRRLIKVCRRVDLLASLAATALAMMAAPLVAPYMGLAQEHVFLLTTYSLVLLTTGNSTAGGILRLYDLFDLLGKLITIGPALRFFGVTLAWWFDSPLWVFVVIVAITFATDNVCGSLYGQRVYRQRIGPPPAGERVSDAWLDEFSGLRHFLWITYWQSNVDLVSKHLSTLLAGYLLGPAEAGLLRLARELSSMLSKPAVLIREVVFPDLTRSWHQGSAAFEVIAFRTALLGAGFGLLFVLAGYFFGEVLLATLIGKAFVAAAPVLTLLLLAGTFDLAASSLRAASYAVGQAGKVLLMYALSAGLYLILFAWLTAWLGLVGAGVAACVAAAFPPLAMVWLIRRSQRNDAAR